MKASDAHYLNTDNHIMCHFMGAKKKDCLLIVAESSNDIRHCRSAMKQQPESCLKYGLPCEIANGHDCIISIALRHNKSQLYSDFFHEDIPEHEEGKSRCYERFAKSNLDARDCEHTGKMHDDCIRHIAHKRNNHTLCLEMAYRTNQIQCLSSIAITNHDTEICIILEDRDDYEQCILGYAIRKDFGICSELTVPRRLYQCRSHFFYESARSAIAKQNISICDEIGFSELRDYCLHETEKGILNDALTAGNSSNCSKVTDSEMSHQCLISIALINGDISLCQAACITSSSRTCDSCILGAIEKQGKPELCDTYFESMKREWCFFSLAIHMSDTKICKKTGVLEDECTRFASLKTPE